jgi:hypothetical protein
MLMMAELVVSVVMVVSGSDGGDGVWFLFCW